MEFHFDCEAEQILIKQDGRVIADNLWDPKFGCANMNFYIHSYAVSTFHLYRSEADKAEREVGELKKKENDARAKCDRELSHLKAYYEHEAKKGGDSGKCAA